MVRVHFRDREPVDYPDANESVIGASGTLTLNHCEIGEVINPQSMARETVVRSRRWLATWWPGSGLLYAEGIEEAGAVPAAMEATT